MREKEGASLYRVGREGQARIRLEKGRTGKKTRDREPRGVFGRGGSQGGRRSGHLEIMGREGLGDRQVVAQGRLGPRESFDGVGVEKQPRGEPGKFKKKGKSVEDGGSTPGRWKKPKWSMLRGE